MSKNQLAILVQQQTAKKLSDVRYIQTQMCLDAAMIAANDVFNMGESRVPEFTKAFADALHDIAITADQDTNDLEYTKDALDARMKKICGKHFVPYEERYSLK